jgi:hypothetical protein
MSAAAKKLAGKLVCNKPCRKGDSLKIQLLKQKIAFFHSMRSISLNRNEAALQWGRQKEPEAKFLVPDSRIKSTLKS